MKLQFLLVFFALLFASVNSADADKHAPDPQILIDEMSVASRDLNYDGVFIYRLGKQIDTMRIIHKSDETGIYERLISLTGSAREVIRDKDQVKCFFPENKMIVVDKSRLGKLVSTYLPTPIRSISEFYNFELAGEARVAGKDAWIVNIRPNDKYRYGYQLWIEKESRLLLKSELKNQLGITLEEIIFTQLHVMNEIDDALLQPSMPIDDFTWQNNVKQVGFEVEKEKQKQWNITWLPIGFNMSEQEKELMLTSAMPVQHFVYTDGLAVVSVYVEKLNHQAELNEDSSSFGGVNTYSTLVEGYQVTAVGEVPKSTVKQIASSAKPYH